MSRSLRILHVTTAISGDGASRALLAMLDHPGKSWSSRLCVLRATPESGERPDVEVLGPRNRSSVAASWIRLSQAVRRWRPDIIHTQLSRADWLGRVAAARFGIPAVSTIQNIHSRMYRAEFSLLPAALGRMLDRCTAPLAACFVAVSAAVAEDARRNGARRVEIIPNGLDAGQLRLDLPRPEARRILGVAPSDFAVLALSLLKRQKGIDTLVRAARALGPAGAGMRILVFGDGPDRSVVEALMRETTNAGARIELRGWEPRARHWLRGADAFVMPSRWEGLPVALLEAMARELPCLVTAVAGIEDIAVDQVNAWVVPPEDPDALARGLARLREDREAARRLGMRAARDVAGRFDIERTVRSYAALFERIAALRGYSLRTW